jgi:hypothetical protein
MISIHTYSFDISKFHKDLESQLIGPTSVGLDQLHRTAMSLMQSPSETMKTALADMRFDEEWVDGELSEPNRWYMILLASKLQESPNTSPLSRNILRRVLPLMNWDEASVDLLLLGKSLNKLPRLISDSDLAQEFTYVTQFGHWLDQDDLQHLLMKLEKTKQDYVSPSEAILKAFQDYADFAGYESSFLLKYTFDTAIAMVSSPLSRGHVLLITMD